MILTNVELSNIKGGALTWKFLASVLGGAATFLIGVLDGLFRPLACK